MLSSSWLFNRRRARKHSAAELTRLVGPCRSNRLARGCCRVTLLSVIDSARHFERWLTWLSALTLSVPGMPNTGNSRIVIADDRGCCWFGSIILNDGVSLFRWSVEIVLHDVRLCIQGRDRLYCLGVSRQGRLSVPRGRRIVRSFGMTGGRYLPAKFNRISRTFSNRCAAHCGNLHVSVGGGSYHYPG